MNVFVTGGCGFIGSNFVRHLRRHRPAWRVVNLDKLTYAGNLENLADLESGQSYAFARGDIGNRELVEHLLKDHRIEAIVNFAAESHVDRSILGAAEFVGTNVLGTQVLLDAARSAGVKRFVQVSTDEVYGSLGPTGKFTEQTPLAPSSPYSASKTAADLLVLAARHTFNSDVVLTRCSNNYGPYQFPEKLIPLMVINAMQDKPLPVYGDGKNVRDWIHVEDHCAGVLLALEKGGSGEVYNFGGDAERPNIEIVTRILDLLKKPRSLIKYVQDRPGHDRRYAMDFSKVHRELGWKPAHTFEQGLAETVEWYVGHKPWWERIVSGAYREYYQRLYGNRGPVETT